MSAIRLTNEKVNQFYDQLVYKMVEILQNFIISNIESEQLVDPKNFPFIKKMIKLDRTLNKLEFHR